MSDFPKIELFETSATNTLSFACKSEENSTYRLKQEQEEDITAEYVDMLFEQQINAFKEEFNPEVVVKTETIDVCDGTVNVSHAADKDATHFDYLKSSDSLSSSADISTPSMFEQTYALKVENPLDLNVFNSRTKTSLHLEENFSVPCNVLTQAGKGPHSCTMCNKKFITKSRLKHHMLIHSEEKPFSCTFCDYATIRSNDLRIHLLTHTGERPFPCDMCEYRATTSTELKRHVTIHSKEKPYSCTLCDRKFKQTKYLKNHYKRWHGKNISSVMIEQTYSCTLCNKKFTWKSRLKEHMLIHSKGKPRKRGKLHYCSFCDYASTNSANLKRHLLTHTGERPFPCDMCEYRATTSNELKRHVITHSEEKPYPCTLCDRNFKRTRYLKLHTKRCHENNS